MKSNQELAWKWWIETYAAVVDNQRPAVFEQYFEITHRWFAINAYPGEEDRFAVLFSDITERKQAEEKIKESEKQKAFLLKLSDAIKELIDPVDIQLTACRILGEHVKVNRVLYGEVIDEEQIIINNNYVNGVLPIIATLDAEQFGRSVIDAFKRNEKVIISDITTDPGYSEEAKQSFLALDVVANVGMGLVKGGRWVATFGMHYNAPRKWTATEIWLLEETADRTWAAVERAKAEQALRKSEEKYRTLFTSIGQGFALCELIRNKEGKGIDYYMLEGNSTYEMQSGVSMEMVLGKSILQVFPTIDKWWIDTYAAVVDNQRTALFEKYFEITQRWFAVNAYPVSKERFAVLFSDITERKQAEEKIIESEKQLRELSIVLEQKVHQRTTQLEEKNKELQNMNKELEAFTYVSSHDLQEPLRKIRTYSGLILEKENQNLSDNGKNYFHLMQNEAQRMKTLIQDLLAFSRLNTADRKFENTDLATIIEEVKKEFTDTIAEKHAIITVKEICDVKIIPFQFRQLLHNIIGNALKYSNPKIPPHITIESHNIKYSELNIPNLPHQKEYCHITITDNGIGFENKFSEQIFEVFQRLHGKEEYAGTGIGLAIVKKIVENHNGIITATSKIKKGTTFDIYIPA